MYSNKIKTYLFETVRTQLFQCLFSLQIHRLILHHRFDIRNNRAKIIQLCFDGVQSAEIICHGCFEFFTSICGCYRFVWSHHGTG